jgi:hypothetical protein
LPRSSKGGGKGKNKGRCCFKRGRFDHLAFECPTGGKGGKSSAPATGTARMAMNRGKAAQVWKRNSGALAAMGVSVMTVMMYTRTTTDIQEAYPACLAFNYF